MIWKITYSKCAQKDYEHLDRSQKILVDKSLNRVSQNPLPETCGGYGKPLEGRLKGLYKIKILRAGIRIVYRLIISDNNMEIIVVGMRKDEKVYKIAEKRINKL